MDIRLFMIVFSTIFIAELGDKTQLATFLYAVDSKNPKLTVFIASSMALIFASALGVTAGALISGRVNERYLSWIAGLAFIIIGMWTIIKT
ncbi:MAG: TMEM165/GDT1 family protein [Thermodesulfobacteriota bacterium]|nr:TMEM165/GDT1 family protein [Thermodesulfobacteriota bacterium]